MITRFVSRYRSANLPSGGLRQLGTMHMHIDGGGKSEWVAQLIGQLEAFGSACKLTAIGRSLAGPQREEQPLTYASHTPGDLTHEELDYFSTTSMADEAAAVELLRYILPHVGQHPGAVVEAERVVATIEGDKWDQVQFDEIEPFKSEAVGYIKSPTLPYECHHAINIPRKHSATLQPEDVLRETTALGVLVGGWFTFERDESATEWLSYRSNSFWQAEGLRDRVQSECQILNNYMANKGIEFRTWTIVEQVLGIWHAPLTPVES